MEFKTKNPNKKKNRATFKGMKQVAEITQSLPHRDIQHVVTAYEGKDEQILEAIKELKNVNLKTIKAYDKQKTGLSQAQLSKYKSIHVPKFDDRLFYELVACDDWSSIAQWALPYIEKYGIQALTWLWNQYVAPAKKSKGFGRQLMFSGAGNQGGGSLSSGNYEGLQPNIPMPSTVSILQKRGPMESIRESYGGEVATNQTIFQPYAAANEASFHSWANRGTNSSRSLRLNAVDRQFIKAFLDPKNYVYRRPTDKVTPTALFQAKTQILITTDANGNCGNYIFPQQSFAAASTSVSTTQFTNQSVTGFVPSTGVMTTATNAPGPLNGAFTAESMTQYRLNCGRIVFTPTVSLNNSGGNVQLVYFQDAPTYGLSQGAASLAVATTSIPQTQMENMPFYQSSNMLQSIASNRLPTSSSDDDAMTAPTNSGFASDSAPTDEEGWYLLITGAAPSSVVGKVDVYLTGEFLPAASVIPLCVTEKPNCGIMTNKCIANLINQNTSLQGLRDADLSRAVALAEQAPEDFDGMIQALSKLQVNYSNSVVSTCAPQINSMEILS